MHVEKKVNNNYVSGVEFRSHELVVMALIT